MDFYPLAGTGDRNADQVIRVAAVIRSLLKSSFFRQSAWMMIAALVGGGCFSLVQVIATKMPGREALTFSMLMDLVAQLAIPVIGLQTAFAQQTVLALQEKREASLAGAARQSLGIITGLWLAAVIAFFIFRERFTANYNVTPLALTFTLLFGLVAMIQPVMAGMLQGRQDFAWFGWASMLNGIGRLAGVAVTVLWLGGRADGVMLAVLIGMCLTTGVMAFRTKDLWAAAPGPFDWRGLLRRALPISLSLGAYTYLFTADSFLIQRYFEQDTGAYNSVRLIGRILVFVTAPMVWVMFPLLIRTRAAGGQSNALKQTLLITAGVGAAGALGLTLWPELPLRFLAGGQHIHYAWMVPWFAWCLLPLALANVLINDLLAHERYAAVPWLIAVAVAYGVALRIWHDSFLTVIKTLGGFGLLLVAVCVVFTLRQPKNADAAR
jgi:O-antigen/teichoic acid export membrane protein